MAKKIKILDSGEPNEQEICQVWRAVCLYTMDVFRDL